MADGMILARARTRVRHRDEISLTLGAATSARDVEPVWKALTGVVKSGRMKTLLDYTVVITPNASAFLAYVPAIEGCHALGATPDEARSELDGVFEMIARSSPSERSRCRTTSRRSSSLPLANAREFSTAAEAIGLYP